MIGYCSAITTLCAVFALPLAADTLHDGGRDVSVLIFSSHRLSAVTLTPLSARAWIASCNSCAHKPLTKPLKIDGNAELFAGGALRVTDSENNQRSAIGLWHLRSKADGIEVVLTLPSERYVAAVLSAEAAPDEPVESLRALAIVARTYALNGSHFTAAPSHLAAELCDSTQSQALRLEPPSAAIDAAVRSTAGETLWFQSRRAEVFFSQHCGGMTEDAHAVWARPHRLPYLSAHADPFCTRRGPAAWHTEVKLADLLLLAKDEGWRIPQPILSISVDRRSTSHRAQEILFSGGRSQTALINAAALRFAINRTLGWNRVRSDLYDVALRNGAVVFDGRGHGHGVGLCQTGAAEMASEQKSAENILRFYFPGTSIGVGPDDRGWRSTRTPSFTIRSTQSLTHPQQAELESIWAEAVKRFPPRHPVTPEIVFAPSTELFRQLTTQPGWALASTRGTQIVLQPASVVKLHGTVKRITLLHEMLHVLVETEATDRAPLWLREGLAEHLAGERNASAPLMSAQAIDAALADAESRGATLGAHRAAAMRTQALIARYGLSAVRGWLASGVPSGVA